MTRKLYDCESCNNTGLEKDKKCSKCKGTGEVDVLHEESGNYVPIPCPDCEGDGIERCDECSGSGFCYDEFLTNEGYLERERKKRDEKIKQLHKR